MGLTKKIWLVFIGLACGLLIFNLAHWAGQKNQLYSAKSASNNYIKESFEGVVDDFRDGMISVLARVKQGQQVDQLFGPIEEDTVEIASMDSMLEGARLDFIYLFDAQGQAKIARQYDFYRNISTNVINQDSRFTQEVFDEIKGFDGLQFGVIFIQSEAIYVVMSPISEFTPDGAQQIKGFLVVGSYLSTIVDHVSHSLNINVDMAISPAHISTAAATENFIAEDVAVARLETLLGNQVWMKLRPTNPNSLVSVVANANWGWWATIMALVAWVGWYWLYRPVVGQVNHIIQRLDHIQQNRTFSERLEVGETHDELNQLCTKVNGVLSTLEYANNLVAKTSEVTAGIIDEVVQKDQEDSLESQNEAFKNISPKDRLAMVSRLSLAIEREELHVVFQPQYETVKQTVAGVEALARWTDDELGKVPPCQFIPLAEASGLMVPLGEVLMKFACIKAKSWQNAGFKPITVAVKLSASQFRDKRLVSSVAHALNSSKLAPRYLELSIKEDVLLQDLNYSTEVLATLSNIGVQLVIDDFGVGQSSMQQLKNLPVDKLKLHPSFVTEIAEDNRDASLLEGIVSLGHSMGMSIVAAGVETEEQLDVLRHNGSDSLQGFYLGYPVNSEQLIPLLSRIEVPRLVVGKK